MDVLYIRPATFLMRGFYFIQDRLSLVKNRTHKTATQRCLMHAQEHGQKIFISACKLHNLLPSTFVES